MVSLAAGANSPDDTTGTAPAVGGTYWVGACVDSVTGESDITNQCSGGVEITVTGLPAVTTQAVDFIEDTSATGNGSVTSLGIPNPSQHGVCWSTLETPGTSNNCTEEGAVITGGEFSSIITGLSAGTTYYVRAYAVNGSGTAYGNQVSFIAGAAMISFASPSIDSASLDYDERRKGVWVAGQEGHIYLIAAADHTTLRDIDLTGKMLATGSGPTGVTVLTNGNLLLADYRGNGVNIGDYLFEFDPDTETIVNYWPLQGDWNTSTDGSSIDDVLDVEKGENGHVYVTSLGGNNIYEIALIGGSPGSWSTVAVTVAPAVGNVFGLDQICNNETGYRWAISDYFSTNIGLLDNTFAAINQFSGANSSNNNNSGVTIIAGNPSQMWVTDMVTNMISIFVIEQIDCREEFQWPMFMPAIIGGMR